MRASVSVAYPTSRDDLLQSPKQLRGFINEVLRNQNFLGRRIVTCMPYRDLKLRLINYKATSSETEPETVMRIALEGLDGGFERWIVDYVPVRTWDEGGAERAALVAIAEREVVIDYLERLRHAGLAVAALEIGPVAILRLVNALREKRHHENVLVINFGRTDTYLTVLAGRRLILDRHIDFGEQPLVELLSETLELTPESSVALLDRHGLFASSDQHTHGDDAGLEHGEDINQVITEILKPLFVDLAEEVRKVLVYTASQMRGASVDYIYLLGSVARWPGADRLVSGILSLPAGVLNSQTAFTNSLDTSTQQAQLPVAGVAIASGCALRD
jgi:Tfp pilus assembly PilM family ATPase